MYPANQLLVTLNLNQIDPSISCLKCLGVDNSQLGLIVQHLLKVRHVPESISGVPVKTLHNTAEILHIYINAEICLEMSSTNL